MSGSSDIRRMVRHLTGAVLILCSAIAVHPVTAAAQAPVAHCDEVDIPAKLSLLVPVTVHGRFCMPTGGPPAGVQLLIHGGTYNSTYFDFPYEPATYSYSRAATAAGYATLNIDRVGYGDSTRPLSALLTGSAHAGIVHQLVTRLHAGSIGGTRFDDVILVGHSLGSGISVLEAATYHDVQAVVLTGMTHHVAPTILVPAFTQGIYPAILDPQFSASAPDPGYLTTRPGQRQPLFHSPTGTDPHVIAVDEATKDLLSGTEIVDILTFGFVGATSRAIDVPVLLAVGSEDAIFCRGPLASDCSTAAALRASEQPYFGPAAQLQTYVLPGAGHDINLALGAPHYHQAVMAWMDSVLGTG